MDTALLERADRLAKAIRGLNRGAVLRAALEIGIETMEADPRFQQQPTGKKAK